MYRSRKNRNINNSYYCFPSKLEYEYRKPRSRSKSRRKNLNNNVAAVSLRREYPREAMRESTEDRNTNVDVGLMDIRVMREFMKQRAPSYLAARYGYSPFAQFDQNEMVFPRYKPTKERRMEIIEESDEETADVNPPSSSYVPDVEHGEGPSHGGMRAMPPLIVPSDSEDD